MELHSVSESRRPWVYDVFTEHAALITTGGRVWDAARRLCSFLEAMAPELGLSRPGLRVLELGSGLGWLGMTLARNLPAAETVVLTEQEEGGGLSWLKHNLALNTHLPGMLVVRAEPYDWRDYHQYDEQHGQCCHCAEQQRQQQPLQPQQSPQQQQQHREGLDSSGLQQQQQQPQQQQPVLEVPTESGGPAGKGAELGAALEYGSDDVSGGGCGGSAGSGGGNNGGSGGDGSGEGNGVGNGSGVGSGIGGSCRGRDGGSSGGSGSAGVGGDGSGGGSGDCSARGGADGGGSGSIGGGCLSRQQWDLILGSDLVYNTMGAEYLPRVMRALAGPNTRILYCHGKHRFDTHDMQFFSQLTACGLDCREVREPDMPTPPPSPPPLTELFPDVRIVVYDIRLMAADAAGGPEGGRGGGGGRMSV